MHRLTSALLLGAGVLVTTWVSAPAAPIAPPVRVSAEDVAAIEALAPIAAEVSQEVERLRARLATVPQAPEPARDPFSFGARRPAPGRVEQAEPAAEPAVAIAPPEPELLWPVLAAVMAETPEPAGLTAVIAWGDAIEFLKADARFGDFRVVAVSSASVALLHLPSGVTKTLTLR